MDKNLFYGATLTEIIVLVVIIMVFISYFIVQRSAPDLIDYIKSNKNKIIIGNLQDVLRDANNGDLVFMSGNTRGERSCRYFTNSMFSHVGMLFREKHPATGEDILYIWDSDLGQKYKEGPRVMKFTDKLERYHGYKHFVWRKLESTDRPTTENILKIVGIYKKYKFDNKMWSWWTSEGILSPLHNIINNNQNKIFCSELIASTMQNLKMLSTRKKASWYSPGSFYDKEIVGINNRYKYSLSPIFIKF